MAKWRPMPVYAGKKTEVSGHPRKHHPRGGICYWLFAPNSRSREDRTLRPNLRLLAVSQHRPIIWSFDLGPIGRLYTAGSAEFHKRCYELPADGAPMVMAENRVQPHA